MAVTVGTVAARTVWGNKRVVVAKITPSASYPALGEPITAAQLGLKRIDACILPGVSDAGNRLLTWDQANLKVRIWTALGTEAVAATDQSVNGVATQVEFFGV